MSQAQSPKFPCAKHPDREAAVLKGPQRIPMCPECRAVANNGTQHKDADSGLRQQVEMMRSKINTQAGEIRELREKNVHGDLMNVGAADTTNAMLRYGPTFAKTLKYVSSWGATAQAGIANFDKALGQSDWHRYIPYMILGAVFIAVSYGVLQNPAYLQGAGAYFSNTMNEAFVLGALAIFFLIVYVMFRRRKAKAE